MTSSNMLTCRGFDIRVEAFVGSTDPPFINACLVAVFVLTIYNLPRHKDEIH